jgi:hypothetical protein
MDFLSLIVNLWGAMSMIKASYDFASNRFHPSIEYQDLYNLTKEPSLGYEPGKRFSLKNIFFSQFAIMQTPLSIHAFNHQVAQEGLSILNLDGYIDQGLRHSGYQFPVYSYPHQFIEPNNQLGYLYQSPKDISVKTGTFDSQTLSTLAQQAVIVVKYPTKFIKYLNKNIDCIVEMKPIAGINKADFNDPYAEYIMSKVVNYSDYKGFYVEIVEIRSEAIINEVINIKFDVIVKPNLSIDFYEEENRAKVYYSLGNIPSLRAFRQYFPFDLGSIQIRPGTNPPSDINNEFKPTVSPIYTKKDQQWFINYYNTQNIFQFGKNTTIQNYNDDKKKLLAHIKSLLSNLKKNHDLKKLQLEDVITTDGNSAYWNVSLRD